MSIIKNLYLYLTIRSHNKKRKYLINKGLKIGKNTRIATSIFNFGSEPFLIEIGDDCLITSEVQFITHDGGIKVLHSLGILKDYDSFGTIKVGNNVFIGYGSTILPGVTIGDNVVIGARSVITKDIPHNSVAAGNPCRVIKSIEEYHKSIINNIDKTFGLSYSEKKRYLMNKYR